MARATRPWSTLLNSRFIHARYHDETRAAAEWLGFEVTQTKSALAHEGWGCHLLHDGRKYAALTWQYGSCERCDPYYGAFIYGRPGTRDQADECQIRDLCLETFEDCIQLFDSEADANAYFNEIEDLVCHAQYCSRFLEFDLDGFTKLKFPLLRRVVPSLVANELVSVQPMTVPIGAIFFADYHYSLAGSNNGDAHRSRIARLPARPGMRLYELARELNTTSRELLALARSMDVQLSAPVAVNPGRCAHRRDLAPLTNGSHLSWLSPDAVFRLRVTWQGGIVHGDGVG